MAKSEQHDSKLLSVRDLRVNYNANGEVIQAVNGVTFDLDYGESLGLVGETGAGKTTIAKSILRILPNPPAEVKSGEILLDGKDLMKLPDSEMPAIRGSRISMVFQDPMTALNPVKRIGWQIAEGIRIHEKLSEKEAEERAREILKLVGISQDRFREYPHQFSGGMKQRVVIAIALACNPDLLIADEPTSALDVTIQAQVLDMIRDLQKAKNTALILITHDFGVVAKACDKVGVVYAGEIIEFGTIEQIFEHPAHPYTKGLFEAIPSMSLDVDRLSPINGLPPDPACLPKGCKFAARCKYHTDACAGQISDTDLGGGHRCKCCRCTEWQ